MSLDGVRAWIGLVERRLTMRTRVFLVLVAIAVGAAATAIVLAVDAQNDAITKSDLETVRSEIEERTGAGGTEPAALEAQLQELRDEVAELRSGRQSSGGTGQGGSGSTGIGTDVPPALRELAEKAKEQSAK